VLFKIAITIGLGANTYYYTLGDNKKRKKLIRHKLLKISIERPILIKQRLL
jgi:hypothetical protein